MKNKYILIALLLSTLINWQHLNAQISDVLPGTLTITSGDINYDTVTTNPTPPEAGLDAILIDESQRTTLDFKLDPIPSLLITLGSEYPCVSNIYDYDVFMSVTGIPDYPANSASGDVVLEARYVSGTGTRFPNEEPASGGLLGGILSGLLTTLGISNIGSLYNTYDSLVLQSGATPSSGANWIKLPDTGDGVAKVFSYRGCRTNMQVEFRFTVNGVIHTAPDFEVKYDIVASDLLP